MSDERNPAANQPPARNASRRQDTQPEPRLDRERAVSEIGRFLGIALPEMGLAVEFEISAPAGEDADVVVTFAVPIRIGCSSGTPSCCSRSNTSRTAGCGSILGCTTACASIAATTAPRTSRN